MKSSDRLPTVSQPSPDRLPTVSQPSPNRLPRRETVQKVGRKSLNNRLPNRLPSRETVGRRETPTVSPSPLRSRETVEAVVVTGRIHPGLKNTTPNESRCPQCQAPTWQAVVDGWEIRLDPTFLNLRGEILARMVGRGIYQTIEGRPAMQQLKARTIDAIAHHVQPTRILATHVCTSGPHPALDPIWPDRAATDPTEEPRF